MHCKGKEEALSTRTQTSGLLCSPSQCPHIKRAQNGLLFHNAPCGTSFFRARTSHSIFPHSYTNSPLIRSEKCDFQHSSLGVFFFSPTLTPPFLAPSAAPLPGADPASRPLCPLRGPLQPWEEEARERSCDWSSLATRTWRLADGRQGTAGARGP